jgi:protein TonB
MLAHALVVLAIIIVPLLAADVLPSPPSMMTWLLAAPVSAPDLPPVHAPRPFAQPALAAYDPSAPPLEAPAGIREEPGLVIEPEAAAGVEGGVNAVIEGTGSKSLPDPPPPPPLPVAPLRVYSGVTPPTKVRDVAPVYPTIAQAARVEGIVILEAIIGTDGRVAGARILRSIPLLDQAALDAVRQWQFTPTLLNGVPVQVVMTVTVVFALK